LPAPAQTEGGRYGLLVEAVTDYAIWVLILIVPHNLGLRASSRRGIGVWQIGPQRILGRLFIAKPCCREPSLQQSDLVLKGNPVDEVHVAPSLNRHRRAFGRAAELYASDRGFFSEANVACCVNDGAGAIRHHVRQVNADPLARGLRGRLQLTPRPRFAGCPSLRFGPGAPPQGRLLARWPC
jgi:hypothetical protein